MKKYSVVVRVEYVFEVEDFDAEAAETQARKLFERGSLRLAVGAEIDSVQADEMAP